MIRGIVVLTFALNALLLLLCDASEKAKEKVIPDVSPRELFVSHSGAFGPAYSVELESGKLRVTRRVGKRVVERTVEAPSLDQWLEFWETLDQLAIWNWRDRYEPRAADGETYDAARWSIRIASQRKEVNSSGEGVYPGTIDPEEAEPNFAKSERFNKFEKALAKLLGMPSLYE